MKSTKIISIILSLLFVSAGFKTNYISADVIYDMDKTVDFSAFKSYQLALLNEEGNIAGDLNDLNKKRLVDAIQGNMGKKGMNLAEDPDVILAYGVSIDEKKRLSSYGNNMGWGFGTTTIEEYSDYEGQITLALVDREANKLLWYGLSGKELEGDPKNYERNINKVVAEIFEVFPIDHFK